MAGVTVWQGMFLIGRHVEKRDGISQRYFDFEGAS